MKFLFYKSIFLFSFVLALTAIPNFISVAQTFSYGIKAGANMSAFGNGSATNGFRPGMTAGFTGTYSNIEECAIGLDVMFSQKGGYWNSWPNKYSSSINYIEIPLTANIFFNDIGNTIRPRVLLGPALGINLASSSKIDQKYTPGETTNNMSNIKFNTVDFGAVLGAGVNIRIKPMTWISVDARYTLGLTNVSKTQSIDMTNNTIGLILGLNFGIE